MRKCRTKNLKRLILLCVILSTVLSFAVAQSKTGIRISNYDPAKDEIVSKEVMHKVLVDLNAYARLKIKYSDTWEKLNRQMEQLNEQMEEINRIGNRIGKLARENASLKKAVKKAEKRAEAYRDLAYEKGLLAIKNRKYRNRYFTVLGIKVLPIIIAMIPFTAVAWIAKCKL